MSSLPREPSPRRRAAPKGPSATNVGAHSGKVQGKPPRTSPEMLLHLPTPLSGLEAHALVTRGITTDQAAKFMASLRIIDTGQFFLTLGISERTFQRRAAGKSKSLDANASDRALRLVSVIAQATDVLGSRDEAERWLSAPAIGLNRHKPIDLLQSTDGTEMVKALLTRMDYGVYA